MIKVILVRLAKSFGNEELRFVHSSMDEVKKQLTSQGVQQAIALRDKLKNHAIERIFSSPSIPSLNTTQFIAQAHERLNVQKCNEFDEPNMGKWINMSIDEIKEKYPDEWEKYIDLPPNCGDIMLMPKGETWNQVAERSIGKLNELAKSHNDATICIVSHGDLIRVVICALLGLDFCNMWKIKQPNSAINAFSYTGKTVKFEVIGDVSHLKEIGTQDFDGAETWWY